MVVLALLGLPILLLLVAQRVLGVGQRLLAQLQVWRTAANANLATSNINLVTPLASCSSPLQQARPRRSLRPAPCQPSHPFPATLRSHTHPAQPVHLCLLELPLHKLVLQNRNRRQNSHSCSVSAAIPAQLLFAWSHCPADALQRKLQRTVEPLTCDPSWYSSW